MIPILSDEQKEKAFDAYPCLDPSFEDDYRAEVAVLLEAQRDDTVKQIGEWLNKNYTRFGSSVSQLDCFTDPNWTDFIGKLLQGELPEGVKQ